MSGPCRCRCRCPADDDAPAAAPAVKPHTMTVHLYPHVVRHAGMHHPHHAAPRTGRSARPPARRSWRTRCCVHPCAPHVVSSNALTPHTSPRTGRSARPPARRCRRPPPCPCRSRTGRTAPCWGTAGWQQAAYRAWGGARPVVQNIAHCYSPNVSGEDHVWGNLQCGWTPNVQRSNVPRLQVAHQACRRHKCALPRAPDVFAVQSCFALTLSQGTAPQYTPA